jgi:hypothetical protein
MPKLILGAFVGLHLFVLEDVAELGRNSRGDVLEGEGLGQPAHENLVIGVPFSEEDLFLVVGELLEGTHFFNFARRHHHECLVLALLPPQQDILTPQGSLREELHYECFDLHLTQNWHLVQHDWLTLHGFHITNQFNIFI